MLGQKIKRPEILGWESSLGAIRVLVLLQSSLKSKEHLLNNRGIGCGLIHDLDFGKETDQVLLVVNLDEVREHFPELLLVFDHGQLVHLGNFGVELVIETSVEFSGRQGC